MQRTQTALSNFVFRDTGAGPKPFVTESTRPIVVMAGAGLIVGSCVRFVG